MANPEISGGGEQVSPEMIDASEKIAEAHRNVHKASIQKRQAEIMVRNVLEANLGQVVGLSGSADEYEQPDTGEIRDFKNYDGDELEPYFVEFQRVQILRVDGKGATVMLKEKPGWVFPVIKYDSVDFRPPIIEEPQEVAL